MRAIALLLFSLALAGCQTLADIDARVAQASDKLAARCVELKALVVAVDVLAPQRVRDAVAVATPIFDQACANPPRTLTDVLIMTAEVIRAKQAIEAAKRSS